MTHRNQASLRPEDRNTSTHLLYQHRRYQTTENPSRGPKTNKDRLSSRSIHTKPFYECSGLMSVKISEGLEIIEIGAFQRCTNLRTIDLPSSLKTLERAAFGICSGLMPVKIKEGLEINRDRAFGGCTKLSTIDFPSTFKKNRERGFLSMLQIDVGQDQRMP
jgi:hypothetical protein